MSVTIQSIVNQIAYDLLEPTVGGPGFTTGLVTQQDVLDMIGIVMQDFCRQTGMTWGVFTQVLNAGVSAYLIPDQMTQVYYVFQNARIVNKIDLFSNYILGQWQRKPGQIKAYHEDGLPIKTLEVVPAPNWNGTNFTPTAGPPPPFGAFGDFQPGNRNLSFVGNLIPSKETWGIGDTLSGIPDSFTPYIVFGVLERIFNKDGESRDPQRALYCNARYKEGIGVARAILMDLMGESESKEQQKMAV